MEKHFTGPEQPDSISELYEINFQQTPEVTNSLSWIRNHKGVKAFNYIGVDGKPKNFIYDVDFSKKRYTRFQHGKSLPDNILVMFDTKLQIPVIAKSGVRRSGSEIRFSNQSQEAHLTGIDTFDYIVKVYGVAADKNGALYSILEYLPNGNLKDWAKIIHSIDEIRAVTEKMCKALSHVHKERHSLFLDFKPLNIGFDSEWNPKIIDFEGSQIMDSNGTVQNENFKTPNFHAPEQDTDDNLSVQTDIYSLAATILTIFTPDFSDFDLVEVRKNFVDNPNSNLQFRKEYTTLIPYPNQKHISRVFHKAMDIDPNNRQKSVDEFSIELQEALTY